MSGGPASGDQQRVAYGMGLVFVCAVAWGCNWPITKFVLSELPPLQYRAAGTTLAALAIGLLAALRGIRLAVPRAELWPLVLVGTFNVALFNITAVYAVDLMGAGRAIVIAYTFSIWTALFGRLILGERFTIDRNLGIALGLAGLALLVVPDLVRLDRAPWGVLLAVGTSISWALGSVLFKKYRWSIEATALSVWQLAIGSIPMIVGAIVFEPLVDPAALSAPVAIGWIYFIVIGMAFGYWAWFTALRHISAVVASIASFATPVVGVLVAGWFLGEELSVLDHVALAFVVASILAVVAGRDRIRRLVGRSP
ncbi:MAG: hypothetical protein FJX67_08775 [Alphaproteobacteria bacterium]|nr:hypothetical protein [Alphaproteobacteria bacterium]